MRFMRLVLVGVVLVLVSCGSGSSTGNQTADQVPASTVLENSSVAENGSLTVEDAGKTYSDALQKWNELVIA